MILVFGSSGQVARELAPLPEVACVPRSQADLTDPEGCAALIAEQMPSAVINAAAYTAVDRAEEEEELATTINASAPAAMAQACAELNIPFVTISTDYVFDGGGLRPWCPSDPTSPLGAYGRSKLAGEQKVVNTGAQAVILRTSWVVSEHGNNFVKTMLRLGASRDSLTVVTDQVGGPTPARDLARACHQIACQMCDNADLRGIFHYAGHPFVSWADFARTIFRQADLSCDVVGIPSSDYPTPARRPLNSRLDCADTERVFSMGQPDWRRGLADILSDLKGRDQ